MNRKEGIVVGVFGHAGSGKTRLVTRALMELPADEGALVFDPTDNVSQGLANLPHERVEVVRAGQIGVRADLALASVYGAPTAVRPRPPKIVVLSGPGMEYIFLESARRMRAATVFVDEAHLLFSQAEAQSVEQREIISLARNRNLEVILAAQRPQGVSVDVRSRCDYVVSFRQNVDHNIEALSACANRKLWEPTKSLPRFQALVLVPWTKNADAPLLEYDSLNAPIVWRMEPDELAEFTDGLERMKHGKPPWREEG
jgi:hypothetical protein